MKQLYTAIPMLVLLAFLSACSSVPDRKLSEISELDDEPSVAIPELEPWWEVFESERLSKAVEVSLEENPRIADTAARIREARELTKAQKLGRILPEANLDAGYSRGRRSQADTDFREVQIDPWSVSADVSWEIDLFGKLKVRAKSARESMRMREAEHLAAKLSLSTEVADAWFTLKRLHEEWGFLKELLNASEGIAEATHDQEEAGLLSSVDTARRLAETESIRSEFAEIERQRAVALIRMSVLQGRRPGDSTIILPETIGWSDRMRVPKVPEGIQAEIVRRRPDMLAAEAAVKSSFAKEQADRMELYPSLSLDFKSFASADVLTGPIVAWLAGGGPRVRFPALFPSARANARATQANTDELLAHWESRLLSAFEELETYMTNLEYNGRRHRAIRREVLQRKEALDAIDRNYEAGVVSKIEVFETRMEYLEARRSELALEQRVLNDWISVIKAAGGKLGSPE